MLASPTGHTSTATTQARIDVNDEMKRAAARAARLAEREALWRDALGTVPVRVWHLEQSDANA